MKAIYPGTFDPITNGHVDIIKRAVKIFDHLIVAIAENNEKNPLFTQAERLAITQETLKPLSVNCVIEVVSFKGLLVGFAQEQEAATIIRGLRAISDFEYEFQMSCMNSRLNSDIQTIFLPASDNAHFISSRFVKQIAKLGGDISSLVPKNVETSLKNKLV
jgi:pantetheine-phosphate adenylyltransferase